MCQATEALLVDARDVEEVSNKLLEVNEAFGSFEKANCKCITTLTWGLEELACERRYFQDHCQRRSILIHISCDVSAM